MELPPLLKEEVLIIEGVELTSKFVNTFALHGYTRNGGLLQLDNGIALNFVINKTGKSVRIQVIHQGTGNKILKNGFNRTKTKIETKTITKEVDSSINKDVKKGGTVEY